MNPMIKIRWFSLLIPNIPILQHSIIPAGMYGRLHPSGVTPKPGSPPRGGVFDGPSLSRFAGDSLLGCKKCAFKKPVFSRLRMHKSSIFEPPWPLPARLRKRSDGRERFGRCLRNLHRIQRPEHIPLSCRPPAGR